MELNVLTGRLLGIGRRICKLKCLYFDTGTDLRIVSLYVYWTDRANQPDKSMFDTTY